jgi:hypothetical protein
MRRLALLVAIAFAAGCGDKQVPAEKQTNLADEQTVVQVEAREYAYLMPDRIKGGVVSIEFVSAGKELHEFALARLAPGANFEDFRRELTDGDGEAPGPELAEDVGGVPGLSSGERVRVTRELEDGTYALVCYVPAPDGRPHIEHGMIRTFTIKGDSGYELPQADAVIVAHDKRFEIPILHPGRQTIELRNAAGEEREFQLMGLKPGKTRRDVDAWFEAGGTGPAPVTFPGGMQSVPPGTSVFEELHLEAGTTYYLEDEHGLRARFTPQD